MRPTRKKPGQGPGASQGPTKSNPSRGNGRCDSAGRKKSAAVLKSAKADIGRTTPVCNAVCLMKGLRCEHGPPNRLWTAWFGSSLTMSSGPLCEFPDLRRPCVSRSRCRSHSRDGGTRPTRPALLNRHLQQDVFRRKGGSVLGRGTGEEQPRPEIVMSLRRCPRLPHPAAPPSVAASAGRPKAGWIRWFCSERSIEVRNTHGYGHREMVQ